MATQCWLLETISSLPENNNNREGMDGRSTDSERPGAGGCGPARPELAQTVTADRPPAPGAAGEQNLTLEPPLRSGATMLWALAAGAGVTSWVMAASSGPEAGSVALAVLAAVSGVMAWRSWQREQTRRFIEMATSLRQLAGGQTTAAIPFGERTDGLGELARAVEVLRTTAERGALSLAERDRLEQQLKMLWLATSNSPASILITDSNGVIEYVNSKFTEISGYHASEAIGQTAGFHKGGRTPPEVYSDLWRTIRAGAEWRGEFYNRRKNGTCYWERTLIAPIRAADGTIGHFISIKEDVTQRKDEEIRIWQQAHFDALTELPNRILFEDRMAQALRLARRNKRSVALLYLDLDQFKRVNDTLGHDAGDALLQEVSARLLRCVREVDTVSRVGGDEFVLLLTNISRDGEVADVAHRVIRELHHPFTLPAGTAAIGASIGVAMYPRDGEQPAMLLKNADVAMYWAKNDGRNTCRFFSPNPDDHLDYYCD